MLKLTTAGDDEFFIKIISTFLKNNRDSLAKIQDCYKSKEYSEISGYAHKMLSSYKHLEVKPLIATLTELEGLVIGNELEDNEMKDMIDYLSDRSSELFQALESEMEQIKIKD